MAFTLTWRDSNGVETALNGSDGILVTRGPVGLDLPAPALTIDDYVSLDGGALINTRRGPRMVAMPLYVTNSSRAQTVIARLAAMFAEPGDLIWSDGTSTRTLHQVVYEAGLGGDLSNTPAPHWRKIGPAQFVALDPWWYGDEASVALPVSTPTAFDAAIAFDAALPFDGGTSLTVAVEGSTDAYPVFTIHGPATSITCTCNGVSWTIGAAITSSDTLTIDTRPGRRGPRLNGGNIDWSLLSASSRLWSLPVGATSVVVGVVGSSGATTITMSWEPRWATP